MRIVLWNQSPVNKFQAVDNFSTILAGWIMSKADFCGKVFFLKPQPKSLANVTNCP
jgi:hypothetical protein